jgi:hypothetical protein
MAIRKVKFRVQLRSRMNQRGKNKKHYTEKPKAKQTNNDASGCTKASKCRYRCFKRYFHQMNPLTGSVYTFSVKSNDPIYDDDSNLIEDTATSFSKRRVLTTDDQTSEGAFKSGLQTVLILCRASNATDRSDAAGTGVDEHDHESSGACESNHRDGTKDNGIPSVPCNSNAPVYTSDDDGPPPSLMNLAPLWYPRGDWSWPDTSPTAPEISSEQGPVAEDTAADSSQMAEETTAPTSSGDANASTGSPDAADTAADTSLAATDPDPDSSLVIEATTAGPAPAVTEAAQYSSQVSAYTAGPASTATVPTADLLPVAAVITANITPAETVTAVDLNPATATITTKRVRVVTESPPEPSLGPWRKWIINLIAGRKPPKTKSNESNNVPTPVSIISWARKRSDSDALVPPTSLPHLSLNRLIPETFDKLMRLQYQTNILPAPQVGSLRQGIIGDAPPASNVQRSFVVPNAPNQAPFAPRRLNSDSSALDRKGNTWTEWNNLNLTADSMPFTRSQSNTQLLHPQTGAKMARANSHLTKSQTGHCFLEDAGHRYPFNQGLGA